MSKNGERTVIRCFHCHGDGCGKCDRTGSLFWVNGYGLPYTSEGEKRALRAKTEAIEWPLSRY